MTIGIRNLAFAALLTSALPAAGDSCRDFKASVEALDTARAVRESLVPFAEVVEKAAGEFPEVKESLSSSLSQDVRSAYAKAYSGYADATLAAHEAAARSVAAARLVDDRAIQAALVLSGTAADIIKVVISQVKFSRKLNELEEFDSLAADFEPLMDGFLNTIMAAACK